VCGGVSDEDSPLNPGVIADNVGDNVGDVAGMGSDLFGSFGEASCAALLIGSSCLAIEEAGWIAIVFPLYIASAGLLVCLVTSFLATDIMPVKKEEDIEVRPAATPHVPACTANASTGAALRILPCLFLWSDARHV
jgi:Na+/H+-translocating membrane pyrophosphatase